MTDKAIFWFRQDLRITDNSALSGALNKHEQIYPLYIHINHPDDEKKIGGASKWWLHYSLKALNDSIPLSLRMGEALSELFTFANEIDAKIIYASESFEPAYRRLDVKVKNECKKLGIQFKTFNTSLLFHPKSIRNLSDMPYNVFTPFWRKCRSIGPTRSLVTKPPSTHNCKAVETVRLDDLKLLPTSPNWAIGFESLWEPGEIGAHKRLDYFINNILANYRNSRNIPSVDGTSRLSPHLHFGEISPLQVWHAVKNSGIDDIHSFIYLNEIGWREFSYYLVYYYPKLLNNNFKRQYDKFQWEQNADHLKAWQTGMTGFPIVDAGMRELWHTGYMHNRVRMIVASFLTKNLLIDWKVGEEWFWDTLLDADAASNTTGWQWVAGTGVSAAAYYRIFNPISQGKKFDPGGKYVLKWVPELSPIPKEYIHRPWEIPKILLATLGVSLPGTYPLPLVDHAFARKLAMERYKLLKK